MLGDTLTDVDAFRRRLALLDRAVEADRELDPVCDPVPIEEVRT